MQSRFSDLCIVNCGPAMVKPLKLSGHGCISFWGITPAIDLLAPSETINDVGHRAAQNDEDGPTNVLICSAGDCRHIIKTIAKERSRNSQRSINFYVSNSSLESTGRDLLLLSLILEDPAIISCNAKAEFFLELLGNLKIREQTKVFLQQRSGELIRFITHDTMKLAFSKMVDLSQLRFKDRDYLEKIFTSWISEDSQPDLSKCWDNRLRRDLENRYDTRAGAFDWDYAMNLCEIGAEMITAPAYCRWRETGIAFERRDCLSYSQPNRTLVSGLSVIQKNSSRQTLGYWGDMQSSPFIAFGLGEDALKYRKLCNKMDTMPASEISQAVLSEYCQMIFDPNSKKDDGDSISMGAVITELPEGDDGRATTDPTAVESVLEWQSRYKIVFLPPGPYSQISQREKYHEFFDIVYVGGHSFLDSINELRKTLRGCTPVIFESPKYLIGLPKPRAEDYHRILEEKFGKHNFNVSGLFHAARDDHFCFIYQHQ